MGNLVRTGEGYLRNRSGRCLNVAQLFCATGEEFLLPLFTACSCPLVEGLQQLPKLDARREADSPPSELLKSTYGTKSLLCSA